MELFIGNKNYSTWSLRAWLVIRKFDLDFTEHNLKLETDSFAKTLEGKAPIAKVPALIDQGIQVWDSLAINEYINETYLSGKGWPESPAHRAKARALANEMHSGFNALRNQMPMNIRAKRKLQLDDAALKDIARIEQIWAEQYSEFKHQGGYLVSGASLMLCTPPWRCALKRMVLHSTQRPPHICTKCLSAKHLKSG